jgi:hypothetical protein
LLDDGAQSVTRTFAGGDAAKRQKGEDKDEKFVRETENLWTHGRNGGVET